MTYSQHIETWTIGASATDLQHVDLRFDVDGVTKFSASLTLAEAEAIWRSLDAEAKRNGTQVCIAQEGASAFQAVMSTEAIAELARDLYEYISGNRRFLAERASDGHV